MYTIDHFGLSKLVVTEDTVTITEQVPLYNRGTLFSTHLGLQPPNSRLSGVGGLLKEYKLEDLVRFRLLVSGLFISK